MTRYGFREWVMAGAAVFGMATLAACGNDPFPMRTTPDAAPDVAAGSCMTEIAMNHVHGPHAVTVPPEDIAAAAEKTYSIKGASAHDHLITITAAQFTTLQGGGSVTVVSTEFDFDMHTHAVTITCP
jgi:hypothetical protein